VLHTLTLLPRLGPKRSKGEGDQGKGSEKSCDLHGTTQLGRIEQDKRNVKLEHGKWMSCKPPDCSFIRRVKDAALRPVCHARNTAEGSSWSSVHAISTYLACSDPVASANELIDD
jgi:hypothetical protein